MKEIKSDIIQLVVKQGQIIGRKTISSNSFSNLYLKDNLIYSIAYVNNEPFFGEEVDFSELSEHTDHLPFTSKALKKFGFTPTIKPIYCEKNGKILKVNELKNLFNYLHSDSNTNDQLIEQLKNLIF